MYLTEHTSIGRGRQREREKQAPCLAGPWDHDLGRRQPLNQLRHPGAPRVTKLY